MLHVSDRMKEAMVAKVAFQCSELYEYVTRFRSYEGGDGGEGCLQCSELYDYVTRFRSYEGGDGGEGCVSVFGAL